MPTAKKVPTDEKKSQRQPKFHLPKKSQLTRKEIPILIFICPILHLKPNNGMRIREGPLRATAHRVSRDFFGWCAFAHLVGAAPGLRNPEPAAKFGAEEQIWRNSRAGSKRRSRAPSASGSDTTSLLTRSTFLRCRFGAAGPASKRRSRAPPVPDLNTTIVHPGHTEKPTQGLKK